MTFYKNRNGNDFRNVTAEFILFLNLNDKTCAEKMAENVENPSKRMFLPVNMFIMDKNGDFDKNLSEAFLTLWGMNGLDLALPVSLQIMQGRYKLTDLDLECEI